MCAMVLFSVSFSVIGIKEISWLASSRLNWKDSRKRVIEEKLLYKIGQSLATKLVVTLDYNLTQ